MLENKKLGNIENVIIDYFKMVNQLSYKDISVRLDQEIGVCFIMVHTELQKDMFPYVTPKNGRSPVSIYTSEMGGMFPYDFDIFFDYKTNPDERVYDQIIRFIVLRYHYGIHLIILSYTLIYTWVIITFV